MGLTATYTDATGSVALAIASAPANAATATVERSTDQVTWSLIRGGTALPLTGGAAALTDYEYLPGVPNYYRARYISGAPLGYGASATGQVASPVPASNTISLSGLGTAAPGDALGLVVSLSAAPTSGTITCTTAGWSVSLIGTQGAVLLAAAGAANPVVKVTLASGQVLNWHAFRYVNAALPPASTQGQVNAAATTTAYPGTAQPIGGSGFLVACRAAAFVAPAGPITPTVSDAAHGIVAYHAASSTILAGSITYGSGTSSATSFVAEGWFQANAFIREDDASVTPVQTGVWLVNPVRPFLNRLVIPRTPFPDLVRNSRTGLFDIIGARDQVAVTDLMSGRSGTLTLACPDTQTADDLDEVLQLGEVLLLKPPAGQHVIPRAYVAPIGLTRSRPAETGVTRLLSIPITEVRPPDVALTATVGTWQTVVNTYATWADLIAARATWADVLTLVGTPADVIVP